MKNARQLAVITALGLLAMATNNAKAALLDVTITATAIFQTTETKDGTITYKEEKTSVDTKDLLNYVWSIKGIGNLPDGATFSYNTTATVDNIFTIRSKSGVVLADCSDLVTFHHGDGVVKTGKETPSTGEVSTTSSFFGTFTFGSVTGHGDTGVVLSGLTTAKVSVSKVDKDGGRKASETIALKSGSGPGFINGRFCTATGTVTLESKNITAGPFPTPF